MSEPRRFLSPWSVDEADSKLDRRSFTVRDKNGQALAHVYFEEEPGRRSAAKLLTKDEARRIAVNIAKLPKAAVVAGQLLAAPVSRSFAGFRWCTAQTVALYFTLSGAGNFRSGSAGLNSPKGNLRALFPVGS
jgi:putative heme degradation protein